ncbi:hypothetical protein C0992_001646 [Termitomyces sp. T32_za158]|nr:hypothetical protein C0992_001646 [Termitomyces sp. T32_za158]
MASLLDTTPVSPHLGRVVISVGNFTHILLFPGFPAGRNYDYTTRYGAEKPGEELKENARVWNVYLDEAHEHDMDMIEGFRSIIDGLLVFAAIFSAVVTTFVAQTSQALQPDNSQIMVSLLMETNQLLRAAGNKTSINAVPTASLGPESRTHTSIDVWVNGLFFTSLALSLSTALLSVLAKQWIQAYTAIVPGGAKARAVTRQFRFEGLVKWKLGDIIKSLPLILHCSVAIFLIGLALYISQLSHPICGIIAGITIPKWSLKATEKQKVAANSVVTLHLVYNSLDWVFNRSSNRSVKEIVVEGTCGLLHELHSRHSQYFEDLYSCDEVKDNFFISTLTYALSRLPDMPPTSYDIEGSTVHGQLLAVLKKFSFNKAQGNESTDLKVWKQKIMNALFKAYRSALKKKNHNLSRYLLELSGYLFQLDSRWSNFLSLCACWGNAQDLCDLVNQGIDLNWYASDGWTALHRAAYHANMDVVIALVKQKPTLMYAPAKWMEVSQLTPLDIAANNFQRKTDVVKYLLNHGAKSISHNALYSASKFNSCTPLKTTQLLLCCGWDRTAKDNQNETLLDVARRKHDNKLVYFLEQIDRLPPSGNIFHTVD